MKVIVCACLASDNCKYNGENNLNQKMMDFLKTHKMINVCPEVLGGLPTPRPSAEIVNGQVMNTEGKNITKEFTHGRKKNNENAKEKWESDLEFVGDFNLSKQKQINAKRIIFR
mgnify:FL=1